MAVQDFTTWSTVTAGVYILLLLFQVLGKVSEVKLLHSLFLAKDIIACIIKLPLELNVQTRQVDNFKTHAATVLTWLSRSREC
jgi:chromate transport protein ChrA